MTECDLPPSASAVREALRRVGPVSWSELKDATDLHHGTLNNGLDHLDDRGLIDHDTAGDTAVYQLSDNQRQ